MNFVSFLSFQRNHKDKWEEHLKKLQDEQKKPKQSTMFDHLKPTTAKPYKTSDPRYQEITDALVMFVCKGHLPLSTVESKEFKDLLNKLDARYILPNRKKFSKEILRAKCESMNTRLVSQLKRARSVCLTIDLWSNRQMRGFLGITAHFIRDWKLHSCALACKRFRGRHTAENIYSLYEEVIAAFKLADHVMHITTDSGSNILKAFNLPGYEDDSPSSSDESGDHSDEEADDEGDGAGLFDLLQGEPQYEHVDGSQDDDLLKFIADHDPCFIHCLQSVVKDGFKNATQINKVIAKASSIVNYIRKSTIASDLLSDFPRVQAANKTRWNSQLKMIRSLLAIPAEKLAQLDCAQLSAYERSVLKDLVEILTPFEDVTDEVQGEKYVTSSSVAPLVRGLRFAIESLQSKFNCGMLKALKDSFEKRLSKFEDNPVFQIAAVLDPRTKLTWCSTQHEIDTVTSMLIAKATEKNSEPPMATPDTAIPPPAKRCKVLSYMNKNRAATMPQPKPSSSAATEVADYLALPVLDEEEDPLEFWKTKQHRFPSLSKLAEYHLSIPASSAPVERLFSIAGKIFRPERCRLTDITFEDLLLIRCNAEVLAVLENLFAK